MGALRERDQTIAAMEAEIAEVILEREKNIRNLSKKYFLQVISKLNLLQSEKGRLIQNESVRKSILTSREA